MVQEKLNNASVGSYIKGVQPTLIHFAGIWVEPLDGEDMGAIVDIDFECGLLFEACRPLRDFELEWIAEAV